MKMEASKSCDPYRTQLVQITDVKTEIEGVGLPIARRFDSRYARALELLAGVRRASLDRGDNERWRAMARGLVDSEFCRSVEDETLDGKVTSWR